MVRFVVLSFHGLREMIVSMRVSVKKIRDHHGQRFLIKVGLCILQITSAKRCPQVWQWFRGLAGLFSQQREFVEFDQAVSNLHDEIFMDKTKMRRFENVFTNRIATRCFERRQEISETFC